MLKYMLMLGSLLFCATFVFATPFTDNSNGTVTDQATGLIWQQTDNPTSRLWQNALNYCNALSLAGSNDWRLPNISSLRPNSRSSLTPIQEFGQPSKSGVQ